MNQLQSTLSDNNMHLNHACPTTYLINLFLLVNNIVAFNLSYGHRKRELSFNNAGANPSDNANSQQNQLNDPGFTKQHENDDFKKLLTDKNTNLTVNQNWLELFNPSGQMFHVIYMLPNPQKRELNGLPPQADDTRQEIKGSNENLAYAGPHLFPTHFDENQQQNHIQPLNLPFKNLNNGFPNTFPNSLLAPQYYQNLFKDSKAATKLEAPFIPSQFLGYEQNQRQQVTQRQQQQQQQQQHQQHQQHQQQPPAPFVQHDLQLPQQHHQLPPQNQLLAQHNQLLSPHQNSLMTQLNPIPMLLPHQQQTLLKTAPVYEHHADAHYQSPNLIYMSPNNLYNLYRKPN